MNPQPDPTEKFLVALIANALRIFLTPFYYAARSDMGVQWTAIVPLLIPLALYQLGCAWFARMSEVNTAVIALYGQLFVLGFIRNTIQAWKRRRIRDWSVHSWSSGVSLLEPLLLLISRMVYRNWGANLRVKRVLAKILTDDFIYYVAEPAMLILGAWALWSIEATLWFYPLILVLALIAVRSDAQLSLYLKAHEVMDGKKLERSIKGMLEDPTPASHGIPIAQIPAASGSRIATDNQSVFERLNPELQLLLTRDRATQH